MVEYIQTNRDHFYWQTEVKIAEIFYVHVSV